MVDVQKNVKIVTNTEGLSRESIDKIQASQRVNIEDVFAVVQDDPSTQSVIVLTPPCHYCGKPLQLFNKRELNREGLGMANIVTYVEFRCKKHWRDFAIALDQRQLALYNKYLPSNIYYRTMSNEDRMKFNAIKKAREAQAEVNG